MRSSGPRSGAIQKDATAEPATPVAPDANRRGLRPPPSTSSGCSITAAQWAIAEAHVGARTNNRPLDFSRPLQALTSRDTRTGAMAKKFLLPDHPRFVVCGTDMAFGAHFVFERDRVGSYLAGTPSSVALNSRAAPRHGSDPKSSAD